MGLLNLLKRLLFKPQAEPVRSFPPPPPPFRGKVDLTSTKPLHAPISKYPDRVEGIHPPMRTHYVRQMPNEWDRGREVVYVDDFSPQQQILAEIAMLNALEAQQQSLPPTQQFPGNIIGGPDAPHTYQEPIFQADPPRYDPDPQPAYVPTYREPEPEYTRQPDPEPVQSNTSWGESSNNSWGESSSSTSDWGSNDSSSDSSSGGGSDD